MVREGVCGEFLFTRQLASETSHRDAIAIDVNRGVQAGARVRHSAA